MFRSGVKPGIFRETGCEAKIITTRPPKLLMHLQLYTHGLRRLTLIIVLSGKSVRETNPREIGEIHRTQGARTRSFLLLKTIFLPKNSTPENKPLTITVSVAGIPVFPLDRESSEDSPSGRKCSRDKFRSARETW